MSVQTLITVLSCDILAQQNQQKKIVKTKTNKELFRILYNNFFSDYESMLNKPGKSTMEANRLRTLSQEVFKTLSNMNQKYMKEIFHKTDFSTHRLLNLETTETI